MTRKQQRVPAHTRPYCTNKAMATAQEIEKLQPTWHTYLEFQDCVSVYIENQFDNRGVDVVFWFGPANETFGASVYSNDSNDDRQDERGYVETGLNQTVATVDELAAAAVSGIETYLRRAALAKRAIAGESEAVTALATELAESIEIELKELVSLKDDGNKGEAYALLLATSFADLHDVLDANTLGDYEAILDHFPVPQSGDPRMVQLHLDIMNQAQSMVDEAIRLGTLQPAETRVAWAIAHKLDTTPYPHFPSELQQLIQWGMIKDTSWGNDAMPSCEFDGYESDPESERAYSKGKAKPWTYRLWVNFPNVKDRETELRPADGARFELGYEKYPASNSDWVSLLITDDVAKVVDAIRQRFFQAYVWSVQNDDHANCPFADCESSDVEEFDLQNDRESSDTGIRCNGCGREWTEVRVSTIKVYVDEGMRQGVEAAL